MSGLVCNVNFLSSPHELLKDMYTVPVLGSTAIPILCWGSLIPAAFRVHTSVWRLGQPARRTYCGQCASTGSLPRGHSRRAQGRVSAGLPFVGEKSSLGSAQRPFGQGAPSWHKVTRSLCQIATLRHTTPPTYRVRKAAFHRKYLQERALGDAPASALLGEDRAAPDLL